MHGEFLSVETGDVTGHGASAAEEKWMRNRSIYV
jgi:hypothetical protein